MHYARLVLAFCAAATIGAFVGCGTTTEKCSPATCAGCCDGSGACQAGASQNACGAAGNGCVSCQVGNNCEFGRCVTSSTTGGGSGGGATGGGNGGGATGGGSATGGGGGATGGGSGGGTTGGGSGGGSTGGGSGGGSTGGGSGGGTSTFDAGVIVRPDGGMLTPPTIPLTFMADCGNVTSCAGDEVDAWAYSSGCIDDAAFSRVTSAAMGIGCTASVSNKNGAIAGSVVFENGQVHRRVVGQVNFTMTAGGSCASPTLCAYIPTAAQSYGITGTCTLAGASCVCQLAMDIGQNDSHSYTYTSGLLSINGAQADGGAETYESCITGSTLRYRETTQGAIPALFSLTK